MTGLRTRLGAPAPGILEYEAEHAGLDGIVVRLRDEAAQMVAFSRTKTLLREAASTIERLDSDARHRAADVARLTTELTQARTVPRSA